MGNPLAAQPCPHCDARALGYADGVIACRACVWECALLPAEWAEYIAARNGHGDVGALLTALARRVAVVAAPVDLQLYGRVDAAGYFKFHVPPGKDGDPDTFAALTRKADQAEACGVGLYWQAGAWSADSQRRRLASGTRAGRYRLWQAPGGAWLCGCVHGGTAQLCAHRAWFWRKACESLADPTLRRVPDAAAIAAQIEQQMAAVLAGRDGQAVGSAERDLLWGAA